MLTVYPACLFKEENGYSVIFPDLNHLATCGETLDEAMRMAVDCLAGYIRWCRRDGDIIPDPSPMDQIDLEAVAKDVDPDSPVGEAFVNMVAVDVDACAKEHFDKSVRKTLTIPASLNTALEMDLNFSQYYRRPCLQKYRHDNISCHAAYKKTVPNIRKCSEDGFLSGIITVVSTQCIIQCIINFICS